MVSLEVLLPFCQQFLLLSSSRGHKREGNLQKPEPLQRRFEPGATMMLRHHWGPTKVGPAGCLGQLVRRHRGSSGARCLLMSAKVDLVSGAQGHVRKAGVQVRTGLFWTVLDWSGSW